MTVILLRCFNKYTVINIVTKKNLTFCVGMHSQTAKINDQVTYATHFLNKAPNKNHKTFLRDDINYKNSKPFRVSVEGNIGAGKSTLINYFNDIPGVETYAEPINKWRNLHGYNMLELLYKDIKQWYNVFQTYVQLTRLQIQTGLPTSSNTTLQIYERSVQNNRYCFVEQAYKANLLEVEEYLIVEQWYQWIKENMDIDLNLIVYLQTSPKVVYDRMKNRGRKEEDEIPLQYLKELHESHENWLIFNTENTNTIPVLVIDANRPLEEIKNDFETIKNHIVEKMKMCNNTETNNYQI